MNVRFPTVTLILFVVAVHGETPAPAPAGNALDAARRDLRALPATEKTRDGLGKTVGSASLPTLTIPATGEPAESKPEEPNAPPSPTWLLDALSKTETERNQHRLGPDATTDRNSPDGYKSAQAKDPLAQYLGQWMAPRDLELLRPDAAKLSSQGTRSPRGATVSASEQTGLADMQSNVVSPLLVEPAKNPYLQEAELPPLPTNPFSPTSTTGSPAERGRVPTISPLPAPSELAGQSGRNVPKPAAASPAAAAVSPAAPIIDTRKYFPQLRRF